MKNIINRNVLILLLLVISSNVLLSQESDTLLYKIQFIEDSNEDKVAPNFSWIEKEDTVSLEDFNGKIVFINFWASWCGPCIREMPTLSEISEEYIIEDFKMIGINVFEKNIERSIKYLQTYPVSYTIIEGDDAIVKAFEKAEGSEIKGIPTTYILNREGRIIEKIVGSRNKETFISIINKYLK